MTQTEIRDLLEEKKEPLSANEIAKYLMNDGDNMKSQKSKVCKHLRKMLKYNEVDCVEVSRRVARKIYGEGIKRKLRLYYI